MKISNYFLIAVGGAVIGAATGFAWRALDDAGQPAARYVGGLCWEETAPPESAAA